MELLAQHLGCQSDAMCMSWRKGSELETFGLEGAMSWLEKKKKQRDVIIQGKEKTKQKNLKPLL